MGAKLGQHFLKSADVVRQIVRAGSVTSDDTVLEIGPGKGVLTAELLAGAGKVIAIEKDLDLIAKLKETFKDEIASGKLELIEDDIRNFNINQIKNVEKYKLVANIPYYITGDIVRQFLTCDHQPVSITLLMQKEVAKRIVASDKKESLLSISVKAYGVPSYIGTVKRNMFSPPPKVDSAILNIADLSKKLFEDVSEKDFFRVVRTGFSSKRKMLSKNLSNVFDKESSEEALETCKIDQKSRAEDLSLNAWLCLSRKLEQ